MLPQRLKSSPANAVRNPMLRLAAGLIASAFLVTSCNIPGMQVDESGLGPPTPLVRTVSILYSGAPGDGGTGPINEWFRETCPQSDLASVVRCASDSGFACKPVGSVASAEPLCSYVGTLRMRSVGFSISPSIDGAPTSDWSASRITIKLFSDDNATARLEWLYAAAD